MLRSDEKELSDAELLTAARTDTSARGKSAMEELLRREYAWIFRHCAVQIRDKQLALDCVQESMVQIARSLPKFDGRSELHTWMFTIVRRTAIRFRGKDKQRTEHFPLGEKDDVASSNQRNELDGADSSEKVLLESEEQRRLIALVRMLPEKQRLAVMCHYFEDLSVEDTALRLSCSVGTVKTHLFRARERLKELLLNEDYGKKAERSANR